LIFLKPCRAAGRDPGRISVSSVNADIG
jgi:hypothetical protein